MAVGDKLYLADKATLDTVKTNSQTLLINTNTTNTRVGNTTDNAGTFSVFSFLKYILQNTVSLINSSKSSAEYTDVSKVHYGAAQVPTGTLATVFSSNKPGRLYSVLVTGKSNQYYQLRITVDDSVIVYMHCSSNASYYAGLLVGTKHPTYPLQGTKNIETVAREFSSELQSTGIFYSPLPIKVNSSVLIELVNGSNFSDTPYLEYTYVEY